MTSFLSPRGARLLSVLALLAALALPGAARAVCTGANLFDALPMAEQDALRARAEAVPHPRGLVFRATRAGQEVILVGTNHLPDPRHSATLALVEPLMAGVGQLLVEAGPEEEAALKQAAARDPSLLFITEGPTLPEILPPEDWAALSRLALERGMPGFVISKMRPIYLAMMLGLPPCAMEALAKGEGGLDKELIARAKAQGLAVVALEPYDTIYRLFAAVPDAEAPAMLRAAMIGAEQAGDSMVTLADLYFRGEPRLVWEFTRAQALAGGMAPDEVERQMALSEDLLMIGRNRDWIPVIEAAAAQGPVMVAAGALHMPGADGVLALLEARGWRVARLDGPRP
ncbi:MAG: TraB/GumN family protein [Sphingomonadales bacterium]|nr:TraB/GumN family protein [Sphingomonadales bacterium]